MSVRPVPNSPTPLGVPNESRGGAAAAGVSASLEAFWDRDAATYDSWSEHGARTPGERATWAAALRERLPPSGRILDVGAGTGFLSLAASRMGYRVTALDISAGMLSRLQDAARLENLDIDVVHAPADEPPSGPFDAVVERLAIWTLPDPERALRAWREVTPAGRLVLFEGMWSGRDYLEAIRARGRVALNRWRHRPSEHHASYSADLVSQLPLVNDPGPDRIIELVTRAGWRRPTLQRLRDVEWARSLSLSPRERLLGVTPEFAITADA